MFCLTFTFSTVLSLAKSVNKQSEIKIHHYLLFILIKTQVYFPPLHKWATSEFATCDLSLVCWCKCRFSWLESDQIKESKACRCQALNFIFPGFSLIWGSSRISHHHHSLLIVLLITLKDPFRMKAEPDTFLKQSQSNLVVKSWAAAQFDWRQVGNQIFGLRFWNL